MSCASCIKVHLGDINSSMEYVMCLNSFLKMVNENDMEMVFASCPMEKILEDGSFTRNKYFHQFRCTHCGMVYGMLFNVNTGGEIRINHKVFDPADYPDIKPAGEG